MIRTIKPVRSLKFCQRAAYASTSSIPSEVKVSSGEFGVKVATQDNGSAISTLSLISKAGSRYETKLGVSHFLKNFAYKNTTKRTSFRITREAELQGASLSASSTRENIIYTAQFLREDAPYFIEALSDVIQHTKFAEYELLEVAPQVAFEISNAPAEATVIDSLHNVAFRQGLGNSIFAKSSSGINITDIQSYAKNALGTKNLVFAGSNIEHESTIQQLNELFYDAKETSSLTTPSSKYHGGEFRLDTKDSFGHIAYAFEGASFGSDKESILTVLKHLLGGESNLKWGQGVSPLAKLASSNSGSQISAFNFSYSDAGLFGIYVKAPTSSTAQVTDLALAKLREFSSSVSAEDLKRSIAQAKLEILLAGETQASSTQVLGAQVSLLGKSLSAADRIAQVEKVTEKDLTETVKNLISGKPSVSIQGSLAHLPYADQLKL